jgi:DNA-binding HxlR family transcriptional regulator
VARTLITRDEAGHYLLTDLGAALGPAMQSLDSWARRWSETLHEASRPG